MSQLTKGTFIGVVGVFIWSFTAIFISRLTGYYQIQPLLLAFWRDFIVSLSLLVILLVTRRKLPSIKRRQIPFFLLYGLLLCGFNSVWTISVPLNGAAVATVLIYGSMGFTVPLARWLFRERITFAKILGVIFSLAGCALVANAYDPSAWSSHPFGIAVGILSALLFAFYSLAGKEAAHRGIDTWEVMFFSFSFASLFLLIFNLIPVIPGVAGSFDLLLPQLPSFGWMLLIALALVPTMLGYGLYNLSMRYLPVSLANLIATMEPAFTAAEAYLLLGEVMSLDQIGGSLLIIASVVIVRINENISLRAPAVQPVDVSDIDISLK